MTLILMKQTFQPVRYEGRGRESSAMNADQLNALWVTASLEFDRTPKRATSLYHLSCQSIEHRPFLMPFMLQTGKCILYSFTLLGKLITAI
jgi:hypothetical protein